MNTNFRKKRFVRILYGQCIRLSNFLIFQSFCIMEVLESSCVSLLFFVNGRWRENEFHQGNFILFDRWLVVTTISLLK